MNLSIGKKLTLGFGILLVLSVLVGAVSLFQTFSIHEKLIAVTEVEGPSNSAAYEMEINLLGTGFSVLGYVQDHDDKHLEKLKQDYLDFKRFQTQYMGLAEHSEEIELGSKIGELYNFYSNTADSIINIEKTKNQLMMKISANFESLDFLLDEYLQVHSIPDDTNYNSKMHFLMEMEINVNGIAKGLNKYLMTKLLKYENRILDDEKDFYRFAKQYKALNLDDFERTNLKKIVNLFSTTINYSKEIIYFEKEQIIKLERFVAIRTEMNEILDDGIQNTQELQLLNASKDAYITSKNAFTIIILVIIFALVFGITSGKIATTDITNPIKELMAVTKNVSGGDFSGKVLVKRKDELGFLSQSFNSMIEKLRSTTVSKDYFEDIIQSMNESLIVVNENLEILSFNRSTTDLLEYSPDELKGKNLDQILSEEIIRNVFKNKNISSIEIAYKNKYNNFIPVYFSFTKMRSKSNGDTTYVCFALDVTSKKISEDRIKHLNKLLLGLWDINQIIKDEKNISKLINKACHSITESLAYLNSWILLVNKKGVINFSHSGLTDENSNLVYRYLDENGTFNCSTIAEETPTNITSTMYDSICKDCILYKINGTSCSMNIKLQQRDKQYGILAITSPPNYIFDEEEKNLLSKISVDISRAISNVELGKKRELAEKALVKSEEKFRGIYENSPLGIYHSKKEGYFIDANTALLNMLGYSKKELDKLELSNSVFANSKDRELFLAEIENNGFVIGFETFYKTSDGRKIAVRENARKLEILDSDNYLIEGFVENITDKKEAEIELIKAKEAAEKSDRLKSEFLAQISHEIRTPINTIVNFSSFIKEDLADKIGYSEESNFAIINNAGTRIIRTVDLILNMAEIQAGTYKPSFKEFDVRKVVYSLFQEFKFYANEKGLEFKMENRLKDDETKFTGDEYSIGQIFENLVHNAIKYTAKGFVKVILMKDKNNKLTFEVIDSGIGVSKDFIKNIFLPFTQEDQGYSRKFDGIGIGLALVKKYCDINNATIDIESDKDKGSIFRILFQ